ncbi:enoyl-CoA hydratase [Desertibacillus haloalkaliphilus]|uniref:enoyl-CoA hydratase n=1 Tax=Desertibacillus haloalkaliphilus TaxID=1328930 RepID=UPI001C26E6CD|nr:enoyl-CoA hydratase [Desertibacillus haloalkaliphilus]MBU8905418.1 enoyl-CoA hydratase [Desertibacillus haloalkaliphilus]
MDKKVLYNKDEHGIATVALNRPEAANALSLQMLYDLHEVLYDIQFDPTVRCVVLTATGEKNFCAGADLKERQEMEPTEVRKTVSLIRNTINDIEALPQPVICAINGNALGGGLELALACDIRLAAKGSKLGLTETSLAIIPGGGGTQRLPRLIGKGRAKEMIFTAKKIDAAEAESIGLVEYVISQDELLKKANELATQIGANGPVAVKQAKLAINKGNETDLSTGLAIEQSAYEITIPTKDRIEGLQAFKEKRSPQYKGE